jgi:hypothetical protein
MKLIHGRIINIWLCLGYLFRKIPKPELVEGCLYRAVFDELEPECVIDSDLKPTG